METKNLAENLGLNIEEFNEIFEIYVETTSSNLEELKSAVDAGDAEEAHKKAHSIKGASANLGLNELYELAKEIEEKARNDRLERTAEPARLLQEKLDIIVDFVRR